MKPPSNAYIISGDSPGTVISASYSPQNTIDFLQNDEYFRNSFKPVEFSSLYTKSYRDLTRVAVTYLSENFHNLGVSITTSKMTFRRAALLCCCALSFLAVQLWKLCCVWEFLCILAGLLLSILPSWVVEGIILVKSSKLLAFF